ncbi:hypothetical protein BGZ46_002972, partial [Entomortierella lignicola]
SNFNGVSEGESDQSPTSSATRQGSLAHSIYKGSSSKSPLPSMVKGHYPHHQQVPYPLPQQFQQQQSFPTTATSAIFGNAFDRPLPPPQQPHSQSSLGTTSLIMSGNYFLGPRSPQYIPSPLASPISPIYTGDTNSGAELLGRGQSSNDSLDTTERSRAMPLQSQGLLLSLVTEITQDTITANDRTDQTEDHVEDQKEVDSESSTQIDHQNQDENTNYPYDDSIKVDVTELYENFGQKLTLSERDIAVEEERLHNAGGLVVPENTAQGSSLSLKFPDLSLSGNNPTSVWSPTTGSSFEPLGEDTEKRTRLHSFHGHSEVSREKDQLAAFSLGSSTSSSLSASVAFTSNQPSSLKVEYVPPPSHEENQDVSVVEETAKEVMTGAGSENAAIRPGVPSDEHANLKNNVRSDRKRLSLVTSGVELAAAVVDVKETISTSTAASPMSNRQGSMVQTQKNSLTADNQHDGILSPSSATITTPTTPLTTREAKILASREALLRMSPDKQGVQRGTSVSSTSSSIASSIERPESATGSGDGNDTETLIDPQESSRRASVKSQNSQNSQKNPLIHEGIYGAVPERGNITDVAPERLVFPDQSVRPVPLKVYKVRKLSLGERNQSYSQACQEFKRARSGLDVWALRCMMQDRPALMKDPPTIVKAVAGKYTQGSAHQNSDTQSKFNNNSARMTPTTPNFSSPMTSSISGAHGIGAMIKSASKRLSIDSSVPQPSLPEINGQGSFFYKQKSAKSAVELGSWSSARVRGISNNAIANSATPPPPQGPNGHRNSFIGGAGGMVSSSPIQQQQQLRGGLANSPSTGSSFLSQNKRGGNAPISSSLSSSLRSRTLSDVQAGSRLSMIGRDSSTARVNNMTNQQQQHDTSSSSTPFSADGSSGQSSFSSSYTPISSTSSVFLERPIQRSTSNHYSRRPASMVVISGSNHRSGLVGSASNNSASNISAGSQSSSSLGSTSSSSIAESTELQTPTSTSSISAGLKQQQEQSIQQDSSMVSSSTSDDSAAVQPSYAYNSDGTPIPFADETKSKDEVYTPLTSPIMIPAGGFPAPKSSQNNSYHNNGGWSSPLSAGGGLSRPLTYAGPSSSNSSLISSPSTIREGLQQSFGQGISNLERGNSASSQETVKEKEKSNRYSASSFSSIGSFAKYQKRSSKKDRKKELLEQQQQQHKQQQQAMDQRYSVAASQAASSNDYMTEQSLDKLSDVLPHVDRDRLSIYLQRAYGDEMVAIGLAMSDFRSGQL